jgi:uncharacterized DUF497 family protein
MNLEFEWNDRKNEKNLMKHGISFEDARMVFFDPKMKEYFDYENSFLEKRWIAVGLVSMDVLKVVFTEREERIRIISARKAGKNDEEDYFYGYSSSNSF